MSERRSVWLATADIPPKPALSGDHSAEVVIVGGGITGLTTAYLLQRAGVDTLVLEARRIGVGTTGGTTGKVTSQHGLTYVDLVDRHGHERAQAYGEANQAAIDFVESTVSEHGIECGFTRAPSYVYDRDGQQATALQREADAARRLGLPAMATAETDLPFEVAAAVRFDDQAMFHAGQYLAGLTRAVEGAGGRIFEGSRATDVEESDDGVTITTSGGRVRAGAYVHASEAP
jgi:glycine/D-amino acid oxidase-like deaminating enzyme